MICMPLAFTHSIFNLTFFYIVKNKFGIRLPKYWPIFAILSGLINDFDFGVSYILKCFGIEDSIFSHGLFMHSIGFVLVLASIGLITYKFNKDYSYYLYILSIGALLHILLDFVLGGGAYYLQLFYPFSELGFRIHLLEPLRNYEIYAILDAFLIICFLIWLYSKIRKNQIKF